MNINLHINWLVLDGINIEQRHRTLLQQAVETELTRLLIIGGLPSELAGGLAVPRISAPIIQLVEDSQPEQLGQQIARSVYGGIGHE